MKTLLKNILTEKQIKRWSIKRPLRILIKFLKKFKRKTKKEIFVGQIMTVSPFILKKGAQCIVTCKWRKKNITKIKSLSDVMLEKGMVEISLTNWHRIKVPIFEVNQFAIYCKETGLLFGISPNDYGLIIKRKLINSFVEFYVSEKDYACLIRKDTSILNEKKYSYKTDLKIKNISTSAVKALKRQRQVTIVRPTN
jgi:hypothetical protein